MDPNMYITTAETSEAAKAFHDNNIEVLERIHCWREPAMVKTPFIHTSQEFKQIAKSHKGLYKSVIGLLEKAEQTKRTQYRNDPFYSAAHTSHNPFSAKNSILFSSSSVREEVSGNSFAEPGSYNALVYGTANIQDKKRALPSADEIGTKAPRSVRTPNRAGSVVIDEIRKNYHNHRYSLFNDLYPRLPDDDSVNDSNLFNFIAMRMMHRRDRDRYSEPWVGLAPNAATIKSWNRQRKEALDYWKTNRGATQLKTSTKGNKRSREHDDIRPRGTAKRQRKQPDKARTPLLELSSMADPSRKRKTIVSCQRLPSQDPVYDAAQKQHDKATNDSALPSLPAQDPEYGVAHNQNGTIANDSTLLSSPVHTQGVAASPVPSEVQILAPYGASSFPELEYTPKRTRSELFDICNEKVQKHESKEIALTTQEFQNEADKIKALQSNTKALREYKRARTSCEAGTNAVKPCTACVKLGWPCIIDTDRSGKKVDKCARCILQKLSGTHCQGDDAARAKLKEEKENRAHGQAKERKGPARRVAPEKEAEGAGEA